MINFVIGPRAIERRRTHEPPGRRHGGKGSAVLEAPAFDRDALRSRLRLSRYASSCRPADDRENVRLLLGDRLSVPPWRLLAQDRVPVEIPPGLPVPEKPKPQPASKSSRSRSPFGTHNSTGKVRRQPALSSPTRQSYRGLLGARNWELIQPFQRGFSTWTQSPSRLVAVNWVP